MKNGVEVRKTPDGEVDELLLWIDDKCVAHFEMLDSSSAYLGFYPPDGGCLQNWLGTAETDDQPLLTVRTSG